MKITMNSKVFLFVRRITGTKNLTTIFRFKIKSRRFWGEINNKHDRLSIS